MIEVGSSPCAELFKVTVRNRFPQSVDAAEEIGLQTLIDMLPLRIKAIQEVVYISSRMRRTRFNQLIAFLLHSVHNALHSSDDVGNSGSDTVCKALVDVTTDFSKHSRRGVDAKKCFELVNSRCGNTGYTANGLFFQVFDAIDKSLNQILASIKELVTFFSELA